MKVELITDAQSDLTVVNAARVSFGKRKETLDEGDTKLIKYLFDHKHWSPFAHAREVFDLQMDYDQWNHFLLSANLAGFEWEPGCSGLIVGSLWAWLENYKFLPNDIGMGVLYRLAQRYPTSTSVCLDHPTKCSLKLSRRVQWYPDMRYVDLGPWFSTYSFRMKTSIFVARQLVKHQQKLAWNEVSRRYVDDYPEFHEVDVWRKRAANVKQGSSDEEVTHLGSLGFRFPTPTESYEKLLDHASDLYREMLIYDVAPEQARAVLPLSTMTEWIWTGSKATFERVCKLRLDPHAQKECREPVAEIAKHIGFA